MPTAIARRLAGSARWGRLQGRGLDWFELVVLAAVFLLAAAPLAWLAWRASVHDQVWLGIDAGTVADQWQYLAWVRDGSEHLLLSNRFDTQPTHAVFLHPGITISGALHRIGLSSSVAYLVWKPVAVVLLFLAARAYVYRLLAGQAARRGALVLALLFLSPVYILSGRAVTGLSGIWIGFSSSTTWFGDVLWGYSFGVLAVAAVPAALLAYERDRTSRRLRPWAPLLGLASSWLHPWQGATLISIIVGTEAILLLRRRRRRPGDDPGAASADGPPPLLALATLGAALAPLVYYAVLSRSDPAWETAQKAVEFLDPPFWSIALVMAPLALPALLAYRRLPDDFQGVAVRLWPLASLGLEWFISTTGAGTFAAHALRGLTIPLAILAVTGLGTIRWTPARPVLAGVGAAAVALLVLPSTGFAVDKLFRRVDDHTHPFFLTHGEREALDYLERSPEPGTVYAPAYMGQAVPAETGRQTAVGHLTWTPDYAVRVSFAARLFDGRLPPLGRRVVVQRSGVRFLLSGCQDGASLTRDLRAMLVSVRRFGCATVYEVGSGGATNARPERSRLVHESGGDVIVLASGRIPVSPGAAAGRLERVRVEGERLTLEGWAVDPKRGRPADYVIVFASNGSIVAAEPTVARPDVAKGAGEWSGFRLLVTDREPRRLARPSGLRVFAVAGGRASELEPTGAETFAQAR